MQDLRMQECERVKKSESYGQKRKDLARALERWLAAVEQKERSTADLVRYA